MQKPNKNLGQHWLKDKAILNQIADYAGLTPNDTVLEIGPGPGTLTEILSNRVSNVIAVEFDPSLAAKINLPNTTIINEDFLKFNLKQLPVGYKVAANIPYYITGKIIEKLLTSDNKPSIMVLLVQKEVAERVVAQPGGDMSLLSVMSQYYAKVDLGIVVPADKFTPSPKVDSQIIILTPRKVDIKIDEKLLFRAVKAGFSQRRKKLRTSLAGGMNIPIAEAEELLKSVDINLNFRAQDLTLDDWKKLAENVNM